LTPVSSAHIEDARFPTHPVAHWQDLRAVAPRARQILKDTNAKMNSVETDRNLSPEGVKRARAEIGKAAIAQLNDLAAPSPAVERRMKALNEKTDAALAEGSAQNSTQGQVASEIRSYVANSDAPAMTAHRLIGNKKALAAVLDAPAFLSGLNDDEHNALRSRAGASTDSGKEAQEIGKALEVNNGTVRQAVGKIAQRAHLQHHDGDWNLG
jgi:hypothetical protein